MYAVIKTGGKQYRVAPDDVITIERLDGDNGSTVEFTEVLLIGGNGTPTVGTPTISGAKVTAELVEQTRGPKLIAFKKRRRKNSRRKKGHRQDLTKVRITNIVGAWRQPAPTTRQVTWHIKRQAARHATVATRIPSGLA